MEMKGIITKMLYAVTAAAVTVPLAISAGVGNQIVYAATHIGSVTVDGIKTEV